MEKKARKNINLYTIYELFGYNLHFYYIIQIFFLTEIKRLSITEFLLLNTVISLSMSIFLIPAGIITDKIGRKRCIVLGNLLLMAFGITLILSSNFFEFIVATVFLGAGYALKSTSESSILIDSLTFLKREEEFGKIEGRAFAIFSYVSCILALITGYIYTLNNYLPIILMIAFSFIAFILSIFFTDVELKESPKKEVSSELGFLKECVKHIFLSKRLRALLLFAFVFVGVIVIGQDFSQIALKETDISVTVFGVIQACFCLFTGLGAGMQFRIEQRKKNKTLKTLSIIYIISFIIISIVGMLKLDSNVGLIVLMMFIQSIIEGAYGISSERYITNFTSQEVRGKMLSILYLLQEIGTTIFLAIATLVLDKTASIYMSYMILGIAFLIIFIVILNYMKNRFGLDPNQYTEEDIKYDD